MGRTKKRMLGVLMTLVMVIGLMPATALAAECENHTEACIDAVQELVDTLPDMTEIDAENREEVIATLEAIDEAKLHLTDEEREEIDWTKYSDAAFVLCTPAGWFGFCLEKRYEVTGDNPAPMVSFINEDGDAEAMVSAVSMASMTETELEPNGDAEYFYLPEGEYDVCEEVEGEWDMTLSVNGEEEDSFEGTAGRAYRLVLANTWAGYPVWVDGVRLSAGEYLGNDGNTYAEKPAGGYAYLSEDGDTLTLYKAKIEYTVEGDNYPGAIYTEGDLNIELKGKNQISVKGEAEVAPAMGIMASGDLKIVDDDDDKEDSLKVNVSEVADEDNGEAAAMGIVSAGSVSINGVTVDVTTKVKGAYVCGTGILALNGLVIGEEKPADVNVTANVTGDPIFMGSSPAVAEMDLFGLESVQQKASTNGDPMPMLLISAVGAYGVAVLEGSALDVQAKGDVFGMTARELYVDKGTDVTISADPAENEAAALVLGNEPMVNPEKVLYANGEAWDYESVANLMPGMVAVCENGRGEMLELCAEEDGEENESTGPVFATEITFEDALKLTVKADQKTVEPGDEVLFTITLENMMSEPLMECSLDEEYYEVYDGEFMDSHMIGDYYGSGILDYSILVENIADKEQFENGYFCDAEGNPIKEIRVPRPAEPVAVAEDDMTTDDNSIVYDVETVIPVLNADVEGFDENEYGRNENGFAMLLPGEKAVLYYKATVKDDAEGGKAESTVEVRTAIGNRYEGAPCLLDTDDSGEQEDNELESKFEALGEDDMLLLLNPVAKASVEVNVKEKATQKKSVTYEKPDVEVIGEGADVYVARRFVSVFLEEGAEIAKVTVNGEEIAVSAGNRIDGLDEKDKVVIWIVAEGETPVVEEQKEIILTVGQLYAWVFDQYVTNDVAPVIRNSRTMLPARFVVEALGGAVAWNEAEQKVTITKDGDVLEIFINEPFATVNGKPVELDAPAFIEADRTYLPLRFVAEYLGAEVNWDAQEQSVTITVE